VNIAPMAGRTVLVTGSTGGIGRATALGLAAIGAHVAITGRDRRRTEAAARELRSAAGGQVDAFVADLSSQSEVRRLADEVLGSLARIDVLVNNAGGYWHTRHVTADGLEHTFALNHLAPFLLTNLLLDRLRASAPARVVTVSSNAHTAGRIEFDDLQSEQSVLRRTRLQPVEARQRPLHARAGREAAGNRGHRQCATSGPGEHVVRSRGSERRPAPARPVHAAVHEVPGGRRRHVGPPGFLARPRGSDGPLLRQRQIEELFQAEPRRGRCGETLAGERRLGRRVSASGSCGSRATA
jgi:NAD(P)-dependent dehydrogenase (short-subunit alcohol dehydrogenase family)